MSGIDNLFGPLGKNYCFYFYILSVFGIIALLMVIIISLYIGITTKKGFAFYFQALTLALVYGMIYLQNRLLFNMCSQSL